MTKLAGALLAMTVTALLLGGAVIAAQILAPLYSDPDIQFWMNILWPLPLVLMGVVAAYRRIRKYGFSNLSAVDD